jgi:hypothetical protein
LSRKWLIVNEELAYKKISCLNAAELRNTGIYLYKIRYKLEKKITNL